MRVDPTRSRSVRTFIAVSCTDIAGELSIALPLSLGTGQASLSCANTLVPLLRRIHRATAASSSEAVRWCSGSAVSKTVKSIAISPTDGMKTRLVAAGLEFNDLHQFPCGPCVPSFTCGPCGPHVPCDECDAGHIMRDVTAPTQSTFQKDEAIICSCLHAEGTATLGLGAFAITLTLHTANLPSFLLTGSSRSLASLYRMNLYI